MQMMGVWIKDVEKVIYIPETTSYLLNVIRYPSIQIAEYGAEIRQYMVYGLRFLVNRLEFLLTLNLPDYKMKI